MKNFILPEVRDRLAAGLEGRSKEIFLGLIEVFNTDRVAWSDNAQFVAAMPVEEIPRDTLKAVVEYMNEEIFILNHLE